MSSAVVGYIQRYGKKECWNWAMSLKRHYTGNVYVIASEIEQDTYEWLKSLGFTVYLHTPERSAPVVTRFLYMWKLIEMGKITEDWIMMSDVKDVVFQGDLAIDHTTFGGWTSWLAGGENVTYEDEPWGRDNLARSFPYSYDTLAKREIVNAGTFSAKREVMRDICQLVYTMSVHNAVHNPDQAALNVVFHSMAFPDAKIGSIDMGYAIQIGTTMDPNKNLKQIGGPAPIIENDCVSTGQGFPYCIVHQYDRNPVLKSLFDEKYKEGA